MAEILITSFEDARECYRSKDLRQALYDAGEVIMGDVLVNLHGDEHRARRRLENRLFRRDTFFHYERDLFPEIIEKTVKPYIADGKAELVDFGHQMMMNLAALTAGVDRPEARPKRRSISTTIWAPSSKGPPWPTTPVTRMPNASRSRHSCSSSTKSSSSLASCDDVPCWRSSKPVRSKKKNSHATC